MKKSIPIMIGQEILDGLHKELIRLSRENEKLKKDLEMDVFTILNHMKAGKKMAAEIRRLRGK